MIQMEQKTCLLEIETPGERKGYFYFEDGVLFDAVFEELNGEEAALAIIPRVRAKIRFKNLAKGKKRVSRRIKKDLMALLMDAMRLKDETGAGDGTAAAESEYEKDFFSETEDGAFDDELDLLDFDSDGVEDERAAEKPPVAEAAASPAAAEPPPGKKTSPAPAECSAAAVDPDMDSVLAGLRDVNGYRGAAVLDEAGDVLVQDVVERDLDMELFAAMVLDFIRAGRKVSGETGLGVPRELILSAESGVLLCVSPAPTAGEPFHALVLMGPNGNRAMAKISLKKILPALEAALA
jgi:predicted regulator of Ras-like GTPase activity (Roadblock/LC7/MglB family)